MTPKQAEKQRILYAKLTAGIKVKPSEYPAWQRNAGKDWEWTPADENRSEYHFRAEYETHMRAIHGNSWEPNPAAISWDAYHALERGERCEICARPGLILCDTCRHWSLSRLDPKRERKTAGQRYEYFAA